MRRVLLAVGVLVALTLSPAQASHAQDQHTTVAQQQQQQPSVAQQQQPTAAQPEQPTQAEPQQPTPAQQEDPSVAQQDQPGSAPGAQTRPDGILPARRIVSYYGNPVSPILGVLGEAPIDQTLARLQEQADAYAALDPQRPVQPALELIAVLAQAGAGDDGGYRARMSAEMLDQFAGWADANGYLLILDIQPGHAAILDEVDYLLPWLRLPHVHLALDPEFTMPGATPPGQGIGTLDADAVNATIDLLATEVDAQRLPPKVLIVHRFLETMVTNYATIRPDPRVQVVIDMDGFGSPTAKLSKYAALVRDQPVQFAGIKLFYKHDAPVLSPAEVLNLDPPPDVIIYQ